MASKYDYISELLRQYREKNIYRELLISEIKKYSNNNSFYLNKKKVINLCSNDYLGLSQKPAILTKTRDALKQISQCSSRLISGNNINIEKLETILAKHRNSENALVYPTGYMANLGVISALSTVEHTIFSDSLNHASIIDACHLSKLKKIKIFKHNDINHLKILLQKNSQSKKIIVTEGVFSMDGDIANLNEISELAKKHDAILIVDDAHADFVFGDVGNSGGIPEYYGVAKDVDVHISSLSKGLGCFGGYAASSNLINEFLVNKSRQFIYTSALPEHLAVAAITAISFLKKNKNIQKKFFKKIYWFFDQLTRLGFNIGTTSSQIIPIIIGDEKIAISFSKDLFKEGIFVQAIRYPTVEFGKARLRISLNDSVEESQLNYVTNCLVKLGRKYQII
ncbi:MAG TPA: aminotransferase class I/II-fold pyridoxal phosphate-dependent enzyme [Nitrososphaeraceae archaeon]|nr:aminotransferase class I/II-fold pyridoxal phosphate-dependent enzyme [Nitrososphaeraceae archaeon]